MITAQNRLRMSIGLIMSLVVLASLWFASDIIIDNMQWNDFLPRYIGCNAMLADGTSPYSETIREAIAEQNPANNVEQRFSYPAQLCFVLLPFWLLPYAIAVRLWLVLNFVLIGSVVGVFAAWFRHRLTPPVLLTLFLVIFLGYRYSMMTIVLGQFTAWVMACALLMLWALWREQTMIAALAAIGLTIRPDGIIVLSLLSLGALYKRQWQPLALGGAGTLLLWAATHLLIGNWEPIFIQDTIDYSQYNTNVLWLPQLFDGIGLVLWLGSLMLMLHTAWRVRSDDERQYYLTIGNLALIGGLVLLPQTNAYTLVYALPSLFYVLHLHWQSCLVTGLWLIPAAVLPWLFAPGGILTSGVDQIVYPFGLLLFLWWHTGYHETAASPELD